MHRWWKRPRMSGIRPGDVLARIDVCDLCGGISRGQLARLIEKQGFPPPFKTVHAGYSSDVALWNGADVRAWLNDNRAPSPMASHRPRRS